MGIQYIDSININVGVFGGGSIENTKIDDSSYWQVNSVGGTYDKRTSITFLIDPVYAGRDFYFSYWGWTDESVHGMRLYINGVPTDPSWKATVHFHDMEINGVTSIYAETPGVVFHHIMRVYHFKLVEIITGYPHKFNDVAPANIGKINDVLRSNIAKINDI